MFDVLIEERPDGIWNWRIEDDVTGPPGIPDVWREGVSLSKTDAYATAVGYLIPRVAKIRFKELNE